jgi:putative peptidoglycan lipid II flippase
MACDKGLGFLRQVIIAHQFGLSPELDAFNTANNYPDLLFALISGGALAIAFIPVLSEYLTQKGRPAAWDLFSRIANLAFVVTAILALALAFLADPLVKSQIGIAPGFTASQQNLVADLMRLNLIATLIFSISGLVMAGLQANQHFLLPALAPLLYNLGQIFGATILAPQHGYRLGPLTLPAFGMGIHGLVYGVILGAVLHLAIQIPGLIRYQFHWTPRIGLSDPGVHKVLRLLAPRLVTMLFIQITQIIGDNLASRLPSGAVSSLVYGWMIMQVPETVIGTAIGTALLPTLAEQAARGDKQALRETSERAFQVIMALTLPIAAILSVGVGPLIHFAFGFDAQATELVTWVTRVYLFGIIAHSLIEVASRSFYAQQNARIPLITSAVNAGLFFIFALAFYAPIGAAGIALANTLSFSAEATLLLWLLDRRLPGQYHFVIPALRAGGSALIGAGVVYLILRFSPISPLLTALAAICLGGLAAMPLVWKEMRVLIRL